MPSYKMYSTQPDRPPSALHPPLHPHATVLMMVNYLWLVWYRAKSGRGLKHWAFVINYEMDEEAYGTVYQAIADSTGKQFTTGISRAVVLHTARSRHEHYHGRMLLGEIIDDVIKMMEEYGNTATEIVNSSNESRAGSGDLNCQDWILIIVRSLEDAGLLPNGALKRAKDCPRYDK